MVGITGIIPGCPGVILEVAIMAAMVVEEVTGIDGDQKQDLMEDLDVVSTLVWDVVPTLVWDAVPTLVWDAVDLEEVVEEWVAVVEVEVEEDDKIFKYYYIIE
jgi:hypothetical protein